MSSHGYHGYYHHGDVGVEEHFVGYRGVEQAREYVLFLVRHGYQVDRLLALYGVEVIGDIVERQIGKAESVERVVLGAIGEKPVARRLAVDNRLPRRYIYNSNLQSLVGKETVYCVESQYIFLVEIAEKHYMTDVIGPGDIG